MNILTNTYTPTPVRKTFHLLCMLCLLTSLPLRLHAQFAKAYTTEHPLIVACNVNFPPYEFSTSDGTPKGYNIDIVKTILDEMDIPYRFVMKEWSQATYLFDNHEADLIIDPVYKQHPSSCFNSRSTIDYYKLKIVQRADCPPILSPKELQKADGLVIRKNDFITTNAIREKLPLLAPTYLTADDALQQVVDGRQNYFIWGEEPLRWYIRERGLQDKLILGGMTLFAGESHFVAYDHELIRQLDDHYARMDQNGQLQTLRTKWFSPEVYNNKKPLTILGITIVIIIFAVLLFFANRHIERRVKKATEQADDLKNMMKLALSQGDYEVLEYDVNSDHFVNRYGSSLLPPEGVTMQQFISMFHPDDQPQIHHANESILSGKSSNCCLELRWKPYNGNGEWRFVRSYAVVEYDQQQAPHRVVCTVKDITEEYEQVRRDSELAQRFSKMFEYSLVGMSFFNADGKLIDLNRMMRQICEIDNKDDHFFLTTNLFDYPSVRDDIDRDGRDALHVCQHMYYPEAGIDKYIELRILPSYDNDRLQHYIMTCRDITAERELHIEQRHMDKQLLNMNEQLNLRERELNYLLSSSNMWVWRTELSTRQIIFSRSLKQDGLILSFDEYMSGIYEEERAKAMEAFGNMKGTDKDINVTLHMYLPKVSNESHWYAINGIPVRDDQGNVTGHFGVVRDVTTLMNAQQQLLLETSRAEDSGKQKSVFLANMTHEIRTPLNAIVGFSDLLQIIDNPTERHEFIRIIRNNCDMLIRLIDDIIEASAMNQGPLAIESKDVDFAVAFNDICQTLASRVQEAGVEFIVDNPYSQLLTHVDKGRLQQVITNFTTNAVKYTHQGHIKVGYRYQDGGIRMYCEDTGDGIPKEKQGIVFERFVKLNDYVQGTGLGLSICKSIADRCGGRIGVESEGEGKGSTFWIWIPCECQSVTPATHQQ